MYLILRDQERLSVFERNMLQGGYLDVNRGGANRTGWNSTIGSFVTSKSRKGSKDNGKIEEM